MVHRMITDEELIVAAAQVRESMLCVLPEPRECTGQFSSQFEAKIEKLRKTAAKKASRRKFTRHAVAAVLVVLIGLSMLCALNTEVRAAFVTWFKETFGEYTTYWFASEENNILPEYELTWVPEGCELVYEEFADNVYVVLYESKVTAADYFTFDYALANNNSQLTVYSHNGKHEAEQVNINGLYGELYLSENLEEPHALVWFDEENGVVFTITSYMKSADMLHIAENVKLVK